MKKRLQRERDDQYGESGAASSEMSAENCLLDSATQRSLVSCTRRLLWSGESKIMLRMGSRKRIGYRK